MYFLYGHKPQDVDPGSEKLGFFSTLTENVLPKVLWIGCSVATIGLQFYFLNLPGYTMMIMIGSSATQIGIFLYILLSLTKSAATQKYMPVLYRAVPLMLVSVYVYYFIIPLHPEPDYH